MSDPSGRADAQAMWDSVRNAFNDIERTLQKIIAARAWLPLGHETFTQAWDAQLRGVPLANSAKPYVIYAMLDDNQPIEDIASVTGWGIDQVSRAAEDHALGVPVEGATVVRRHVRRPRGAARMVHLEFAWDEYAWLKEFAKSQGLDLSAEAKAAVIAHFENLETMAARRPRRAS